MGKVAKAIKGVYGDSEKIRLHWHDSHELRKDLSANYRSAIFGGPLSKHDPLWKILSFPIIFSDSVIARISSRKRSHELSLRVQNLI